MICWTVPARRSSSRYLRGDSGRFTTRRFDGLNPGDTRTRLEKLRSRRPAPMSSTRASPISRTTRAERILRWRTLPDPPRLSSFNESLIGCCVTCSAGTNPKTTPVTTESASAKSTTGQFSAMFCIRGMPPTEALVSSESAHAATINPAAPPTHDRTTLSTTSWRMTRARLAPSAIRSAISFCRSTARASSRLATLAQAISRTSATAPVSSTSAGRMFCTS